jgi:hypothetical protein
MKRILTALFALWALLAITGCRNTSLVRNFNLVSNDSTYDAAAVTIAVDAAGWKHVAWSECKSPSQCRIVYTKFLFSTPTNFTYIVPIQPLVYSYEAPDIAVTSSGTAYLAWRRKKIADNSYIDCWNKPLSDTGCMVMQTNPIPVSWGLPRVAARGEAVYAVYEVLAGTGTALYYEQLNPLYHSKGEILGTIPGILNTDTDLAISGDGTLHVVWRNTTNPTGIHYNSNAGATGNMDHHLATVVGKLTPPRIACDDAPDFKGQCFIAYGDTAPASDTLSIQPCPVANCVSGEERFPLT